MKLVNDLGAITPSKELLLFGVVMHGGVAPWALWELQPWVCGSTESPQEIINTLDAGGAPRRRVVDHVEGVAGHESCLSIPAAAGRVPAVLHSHGFGVDLGDDDVPPGLWLCMESPQPLLIHSQVYFGLGRELVGRHPPSPWQQHPASYFSSLDVEFDDLVQGAVPVVEEEALVDDLASSFPGQWQGHSVSLQGLVVSHESHDVCEFQNRIIYRATQ